jgi:hypothetical protein
MARRPIDDDDFKACSFDGSSITHPLCDQAEDSDR